MERGLRRAWRLAAIGLALARAMAELLATRRDPRRVLHRLCRHLIPLLGLRVTVLGKVPRRGLVVCNHLSYLDIVVLAAAAPAVFVAKDEVKSWPIAGWFARRTSTIFVSRRRRADAAASVGKIAAALASGGRVVLFPEGTSTGGASVLPFKSSLLAAAGEGPVIAAALAYALDRDDGDPAEEICYWKDHVLLPHFFRVLGKRQIHATLLLARAEAVPDRKELARELHAAVSALQSAAEAAVDRAAKNFKVAAERRPLAVSGESPLT